VKKSRLTESQIFSILQAVEKGRLVKDVCREYGVAESTYFAWKAKYGGMKLSDMQRLKELEIENRRLKQMYADLSLDNHILKDIIEKKL
jgi:putative transposase